MIPPNFKGAYDFHQGKAPAQSKTHKDYRSDFKWGYIDKRGQWIISPCYRSAFGFNNNKAKVEVYLKDGLCCKNAVIDGHGRELYRGWVEEVEILDSGFSVKEIADTSGSCGSKRTTYQTILFDDNGNTVSTKRYIENTPEFCLSTD